jgi:nitrite reductase/ring-hydroxylating ferredoxin subunit
MGLSADWHALCKSADLVDAGQAVLFDVRYGGQTCLGFAVRYQGQAVAYLNRCAHVAMEMDWRPGQFFDETRQWLMCATHGAIYQPLSGVCVAGPCTGKRLIAIEVHEAQSVVYWRSDFNLQPVEF